MPRVSKARIFRSTQTSPNAGTVRDLTTIFGTAANTATIAGFANAGLVTSIRWSPGATATAATAVPSAGTASSGVGWRDTVGENAAEPVQYDAGTWTLRVRPILTDAGLVSSVTARITLIVYRVTSAGAFVSEVGRVQLADTAVGTTAVAINGSFTTGATLLFNPGDKLQVEAYIQPTTAGLPSAPATALNVRFTVDETSANSGATFTAIPGHQIFYTRALSAGGAGTATMGRQLLLARAFTVAGVATVSRINRLGLARSFATTGSGAASLTKRLAAVRSLVATGSGAALGTKRVAYLRAFTATGAGTVARTNRLSLARTFTVTGTGTVARITRLALARSLTATGTGTVVMARQLGFARTFTVAGTGTGVLVRTLTLARLFATSGAGTVAATRTLGVARFFSATGSATTAFGKVLTFDRRFQVVASGLTRMRIEMPQAVLNRITGSGAVTVIRKFFSLTDDG